MRVEIMHHKDNWQLVKDTTMNTIGKETGKYPDSEWKRQLLKSEHSPIRNVVVTAKFIDLPYWVSVHLSRHKIGIEHFVKTQRSDRVGVDRDSLPQGALVTHTITANAQAIITISRKRLCTGASKETRNAWSIFLKELRKYEPELVSVCVAECLYRGSCTEMFPCGYSNTDVYKNLLKDYQK